jgi:twitching motility protein PilT
VFASFRGRSSSDYRQVIGRIRDKQWKTPAERDELFRRALGFKEFAPEDVTAMLVDSDQALRTFATELLRKMEPKEAGEALLGALPRQPSAARKQTFAAYVGLSAGTLSFEHLKELATDRRPAVAGAALEWARERASPQYLPLIERPLLSPSAALRRLALALADTIGTAEAATMVAAAATDEDEEVRFRVATLLSRHPSDENIAMLLKAAADTSARVQQAAAQGLKPMLAAARPGWQLKVMPLFADANPRVQDFVLRVVRDQNPALIADGFLSVFKSIYGIGRDRAIKTLKLLGDPICIAMIPRAKDSDHESATLAASVALALRTPDIVPLCVELLKSPDWWLRQASAEVLSEVQDERALMPLVEALNDSETNIAAAAGLGNWGDPRALPYLLEAYKRGARDLRLEILEAFVKFRDPRVPMLIDQIIKVDPDEAVQEHAARLAARMNGAEEAVAVATLVTTRDKFKPVNLSHLPKANLPDLMRHARAVGASDIHIAVNAIPHLRIHGVMTPLPLSPLAAEEAEEMLLSILTEPQKSHLAAHRHIDFCYKGGELGRFRTNIFYQRKGLDAVFRLIPTEVPTFEDIGLPESLWELTAFAQGLVLVTGPAGCGKTTTLAAFVHQVNRTRGCHILTIEDPIEYVHGNRESLVNQREVPTHSESFARALRQALREDPDVIMVGEMRDPETIALALTASETGHLVFGTLHTATATGTIERVVSAFPAGQQGQIRQTLADSLKAVIAQSLLPRRDGHGRVAAYEILRNTLNVAGLIRESKTHQIPSAIQTGAPHGMQTMDAAMLKLVQDAVADPRAAYDRALRKETFEPLLEEEGGAA